VQIIDSYGKFSVTRDDCGALYGVIAPTANASKRPGEWQTLDITFRAPYPEAARPARRKGRLTVVHNGTRVIDDQSFDRPTAMPLDSNLSATGPIMLQAHGGLVRFGNIRLTELPHRRE